MLSRHIAGNTATALFSSKVSLTTQMSRHNTIIIVINFEPTSQVQKSQVQARVRQDAPSSWSSLG
jgi:hypothetical protein